MVHYIYPLHAVTPHIHGIIFTIKQKIFSNSNTERNQLQSLFQVSLPRRTTTIPGSPQTTTMQLFLICFVVVRVSDSKKIIRQKEVPV